MVRGRSAGRSGGRVLLPAESRQAGAVPIRLSVRVRYHLPPCASRTARPGREDHPLRVPRRGLAFPLQISPIPAPSRVARLRENLCAMTSASASTAAATAAAAPAASASTPEPGTIGVAVVGLGMGRHHIVKFNEHPQARVVAVCDADQTRLGAVAKEFGIAHAFTDFDAMLQAAKGSGIEAVSIALPNHLHAPASIKALKAGLHVMCEKPLALHAPEAQQMVDTAREAKRKLAVHYNFRMSPQHQYVGMMRDADEFGTMRHIRCGWLRQRGIPTWGSGWFYDRKRSGGGVLIDLGVHMLDCALWAAGFPRVISVTGQIANAFGPIDVPDKNMDVDDLAMAFIRCENGLTISLEMSWAGTALEQEHVFFSLFGDRAGAHWQIRPFGPRGWTPILEIVKREHGGLVRQEVTEFSPSAKALSVEWDFIQAIAADREPICRGEDGVTVMRVIDAIYESSRTGREVVVDATAK